LITGASSGIGAEFARKLASRGMHLVLTARRRELMDQLADELHTRHGTRTEIIVRDLSDPSQVHSLVEDVRTRGIAIELLVINAGFGLVDTVEDMDP
jgi:short-subunit dehydrogenase